MADSLDVIPPQQRYRQREPWYRQSHCRSSSRGTNLRRTESWIGASGYFHADAWIVPREERLQPLRCRRAGIAV